MVESRHYSLNHALVNRESNTGKVDLLADPREEAIYKFAASLIGVEFETFTLLPGIPREETLGRQQVVTIGGENFDQLGEFGEVVDTLEAFAREMEPFIRQKIAQEIVGEQQQ